MASVSFQYAFNGDAIDNLSAGAQNVSEATAAPTTAGGIEVRIDMASGWTKLQIEHALETIFRYLADNTRSQSIPL
jgi:hypothetical protein